MVYRLYQCAFKTTIALTLQGDFGFESVIYIFLDMLRQDMDR